MGYLDSSRKRLLVFSVVLVIALGAVYFLAQPKGTDAEQIWATLHGAEKSGREGKPGSLLDLLSKAFAIDGTQPRRSEIADVVRRFRPDCVVGQADPVVDKDHAELVAPIDVRGSLFGQSTAVAIKGARLTFAREWGLNWGFIPVRVWKLSSVDLSQSNVNASPLSGWIRGLDE